MRRNPVLPFGLAGACFLLLLSASSAKAQCGGNSIGFGDAGLASGNPFHAQIVATRTGSSMPGNVIPPRQPELIARDSAGRVRIERVPGEFEHDNGPEAGTKVEQHLITICDPVAQTMTQIDTLNATAKIIHSRPSTPNSTRLQQRPTRTFCSSRLPLGRDGHIKREDLGDQTIEGVVAHGVRIYMPMLGAPDGGESPRSENTSDRWCSDDLSAVVLTVNENAKTGAKSTVAMQNIERTEPDPSLFQIPPGFAITESVAEPHNRNGALPPPSEQR